MDTRISMILCILTSPAALAFPLLFQPQEVDISCPNPDPTYRGYMPNPCSCTSYLFCTGDGRVYVQECPIRDGSEQYFDTLLWRCNSPQGSVCATPEANVRCSISVPLMQEEEFELQEGVLLESGPAMEGVLLESGPIVGVDLPVSDQVQQDGSEQSVVSPDSGSENTGNPPHENGASDQESQPDGEIPEGISPANNDQNPPEVNQPDTPTVEDNVDSAIERPNQEDGNSEQNSQTDDHSVSQTDGNPQVPKDMGANQKGTVQVKDHESKENEDTSNEEQEVVNENAAFPSPSQDDSSELELQTSNTGNSNEEGKTSENDQDSPESDEMNTALPPSLPILSDQPQK